MDARSAAKLATCHPKLQELVKAVDAKRTVIVVQGERTLSEEAAAIANGKSKTTRSKHCIDPAMAVDMGPSPLDWNDKQAFIDLHYDVVLPTAEELGIRIRWGGAWSGERNTPQYLASGGLDDLDHWELKE